MFLKTLINLIVLYGLTACNPISLATGDKTEVLKPGGVGPADFNDIGFGFMKRIYPRVMEENPYQSILIKFSAIGQIYLLADSAGFISAIRINSYDSTGLQFFYSRIDCNILIAPFGCAPSPGNVLTSASNQNIGPFSFDVVIEASGFVLTGDGLAHTSVYK
jgi:hypothetical protein